MKLRITKGRVACMVVLLPVLYVFNVGPLVYCINNFGLNEKVVAAVYHPFYFSCIVNTPLDRPWHAYIMWWNGLPKIRR